MHKRMADRKTVTLYLYLPQAKKVILSRRGKLEKRAGLLQATVHGQIEPGEIAQIAMKREFEEEVKGDYHQLTNIRDLGEANVGDTVKEHTSYHAAMLPDELLSTLQPTQEVSEFVQVSEDDLSKITPLSKVRDQEDYDLAANWVMYDDELETLKKVFKEFSKL